MTTDLTDVTTAPQHDSAGYRFQGYPSGVRPVTPNASSHLATSIDGPA